MKQESTMRYMITTIAFTLLSAVVLAQPAEKSDNTLLETQHFVQAFETKLKPLSIVSSRRFFDAVTSGDSAAYEQSSAASLALKALYSDPGDFATVKRLRESGKVSDPRA